MNSLEKFPSLREEISNISEKTKKAIESFESIGVKTDVISLDQESFYSEVILFQRNDISKEEASSQKNELPPEQMVRVFRGTNQIDASVFDHIPYAL